MALHRGFPADRISAGPHDVGPSDPEAERFVLEAEIGDGWLHPRASNYTFVVELRMDGKEGLAVYKPQKGEAPLWDFPMGSLYKRECAAYYLSRMLGWPLVPPTVEREGEAGIGSLQLFVPCDEDSNFFTLRETHEGDLFRMAVFDVVANNADRKGGHCFADASGHLWGVDHGLTFNEDHKLRTVIWDYAGTEIPQPMLDDLACLRDKLTDDSVTNELDQLLDVTEKAALLRRVERILESPVMPQPYSRRDVPWPWL